MIYLKFLQTWILIPKSICEWKHLFSWGIIIITGYESCLLYTYSFMYLLPGDERLNLVASSLLSSLSIEYIRLQVCPTVGLKACPTVEMQICTTVGLQVCPRREVQLCPRVELQLWPRVEMQVYPTMEEQLWPSLGFQVCSRVRVQLWDYGCAPG